jgi:adenosylcobinamide kinase/adenosylcobinamide-phosphate guanylyltransferase
MRRMMVLIGGGVRSGKSAFALRRARALGQRRAFIATARAGDEEMHARIEAHRVERGTTFETVEAADRLLESLAVLSRVEVAVIDCLTIFVSDLVLSGLDDAAIDAAVVAVADRCRSSGRHVVVVTNEVGFGVVPATAIGRRFRDAAGRAHQVLARRSDEVYLGALGLMVRLVPDPVAGVGGEGEP